MNRAMMAYPATAVKTQNSTGYQRRVVRDDLSVNDLAPTYRSMARHIGKQLKRKQPVRIPAMNNQALGQLLRCLELRRSWV